MYVPTAWLNGYFCKRVGYRMFLEVKIYVYRRNACRERANFVVSGVR